MKRQKPKKWMWWKHGVIYHIYPRSFSDSNGDGIGDIQGIIDKLDYLEDLGVDAIWLSPVFLSPQVDFGYDVADYRRIDPLFGSLKDFKRLLKAAHQRDIRVVMDLIMNHTSDQHPWFVAAASSKQHAKRDWYIWKDPVKGGPPNKWKTCFGGSAWQYHPETGQYYYHSFFKEQPDLNWRNKDLQREFFDIVEYWLDMGVDGFRLDVANLIIKDKKLRNNPRWFGLLRPSPRFYTRNRPRSLKVLKELRSLMDRYNDRMLVGEIYTLPPGDPELAASYLGSGKNMLNLAFDFSLVFKLWNARSYAHSIQRWMDAIPEKGWPCHVLSNHDLFRSYNRPFWRLFKKQKAVIEAFMLLTLKGTPFIYYGEEIGMQNVSVPRKAIQDPIGKRFWPFYRGRDRARSPMQWNNTRHAGFTDATPWLPVHSNFGKVNVETQKSGYQSLLSWYRQLIALRREHKALMWGDWELVNDGKNGFISYTRTSKHELILVLLNFKPYRQTVRLNSFEEGTVLLSTHKTAGQPITISKLKLQPFEATVVLMKS